MAPRVRQSIKRDTGILFINTAAGTSRTENTRFLSGSHFRCSRVTRLSPVMSLPIVPRDLQCTAEFSNHMVL